jgi:hypothetical protein
MKEFSEIYELVIQDEAYKIFSKQHSDYYLAHGFIQLDHTYAPSTPWQIGFYSKTNDNIAVFDTNPVTLKGIEEAFKDGGIIDELTLPIIPTTQAITTVQELLANDYPNEQVTSTILIVQSVAEQAIYNITVITKTFSMIITRIDATSGELISHNKRSVLDLKKD